MDSMSFGTKFNRVLIYVQDNISFFPFLGKCIKCFQCSSTEDQRKPTGVWSEDHYTQNRYEDNCGVYWPFEKDRMGNVPVECNSDESHTPGTFCVKITRQGPRGFICKF